MTWRADTAWRQGPWWERAAWRAFKDRHYRVLTDRNTGMPYIVRFWLHPPECKSSGDLSSANSLMLHLILAPDAGTELHNHPWSFTSKVLQGRLQFVEGSHLHSQRSKLTVLAGEDYVMDARRMHRIAKCAPCTWTLVQTGPLVNPNWQFLRPNRKLVLWSDMPGVEREA